MELMTTLLGCEDIEQFYQQKVLNDADLAKLLLILILSVYITNSKETKIILSVNNYCFIILFPNITSFSCFTAMVKKSSSTLNRSEDNVHLYTILYLKGNASHVSLLCVHNHMYIYIYTNKISIREHFPYSTTTPNVV